jgi:hypothetical protein
LLTAKTIIQNARFLLRGCGTTVFRNQADLKGHYSRNGNEVMNAAGMAHTKEGSLRWIQKKYWAGTKQALRRLADGHARRPTYFAHRAWVTPAGRGPATRAV